jgi:hypothetical protein
MSQLNLSAESCQMLYDPFRWLFSSLRREQLPADHMWRRFSTCHLQGMFLVHSLTVVLCSKRLGGRKLCFVSTVTPASSRAL